MYRSPTLPMGTALEGGKGGRGSGELDAGRWWGGGVSLNKTPRRGESPKVCRIFYLKQMSWPLGAFDCNIPYRNITRYFNNKNKIYAL